MPEISIADTINVIRLVNDKYKVDLSCLSSSQFRFKLERILKNNNFLSTEELIDKLLSEEAFFELFKFELFHLYYELFRDPEFWMYLNQYLHQRFVNPFFHLKVLIPAYTNSSELLSLLILLEENGWRENSDIYISLLSKPGPDSFFNKYKNIIIRPIDKENVTSIFPNIHLEKYFSLKSDTLAVNKNLFSRVYDFQQDFDFKPDGQNFNLIMFRNRLLNFSLSHQNKIIGNLVSGLEKSGLIVFGYRENISSYINITDTIAPVNLNENVFQKSK
ncbi:MAG: hypothetical protein K9H49_18230 [Bacteroidales bacterium]|nr:hypothetical protein [Bacteroidales bacterium]MCF8391478.1 hypothetical protein [Bacteroidales bacterium]